VREYGTWEPVDQLVMWPTHRKGAEEGSI